MEHPWTFPSFPFSVTLTIELLGKRVDEELGSSNFMSDSHSTFICSFESTFRYEIQYLLYYNEVDW